MAFEDALTLALTLACIYQPDPLPNVHTRSPIPDRHQLLQRWNEHRIARVDQGHGFTMRNGEFKKSSSHHLQQAAKEWLMWASMEWQGPQLGAGWLYEYTCEEVMAALVT